jgi:hypothetical protein
VKRRTASANPSARSQISVLASKLNEESLRKKKLAKDLDELRSNLT